MKMNIRRIMMTGLMLCAVLASAAVYTSAYQNQKNNEIADQAIQFLINGPTFSFDGINDSIKIINITSLDGESVRYAVVIFFDTTHAGWGDREGTFIAQVITPHIIKVTLENGEVVEAVIDETWDELNQCQIVHDELLLPEQARDKAIQYILSNHPEIDVESPLNWVTEMHTPSGLLGSLIIRYLSDGWDVTVRYPVIQYPDFTVEITYSGAHAFTWTGLVCNAGIVTETSYNN